MDFIGIAALGILTVYVGYVINKPEPLRITPQFLWNEQVGKTRSLQAKGDASMNTELIRRRTIQAVGRLDISKLKETRTQWGTATGAFETFMLSTVCPKNFCLPDLLLDGGGPTTEYCPLDGTYDGGNDKTELFCDQCHRVHCVKEVLYEGGNQVSEFCALDGDGVENLLDAGNQNTEVCRT